MIVIFFSCVLVGPDLGVMSFSFVLPAIRHKESNWAKFLMHDLKNAVCAPEHLFHRVG